MNQKRQSDVHAGEASPGGVFRTLGRACDLLWNLVERAAVECTAALVASPGQAYVLRKQRDVRLAEVVTARVDAVIDEIVDAVTGEVGLALDPERACVRFRELLAEAATGRPEPMALNAALLVDVERAEALRASVGALRARLAAEGFALELTGPWPPYSFCGGELASSFGAAP